MNPTSARAAAAASADREAKLRAMFVVVPEGDESKIITCPVCKESLKTQFLEEDEEWVWKNAINVKGTVRLFFLVFLSWLSLILFLLRRCIMQRVMLRLSLPCFRLECVNRLGM